jgi:hypothetical protein
LGGEGGLYNVVVVVVGGGGGGGGGGDGESLCYYGSAVRQILLNPTSNDIKFKFVFPLFWSAGRLQCCNIEVLLNADFLFLHLSFLITFSVLFFVIIYVK